MKNNDFFYLQGLMPILWQMKTQCFLLDVFLRSQETFTYMKRQYFGKMCAHLDLNLTRTEIKLSGSLRAIRAVHRQSEGFFWWWWGGDRTCEPLLIYGMYFV